MEAQAVLVLMMSQMAQEEAMIRSAAVAGVFGLGAGLHKRPSNSNPSTASSQASNCGEISPPSSAIFDVALHHTCAVQLLHVHYYKQ